MFISPLLFCDLIYYLLFCLRFSIIIFYEQRRRVCCRPQLNDKSTPNHNGVIRKRIDYAVGSGGRESSYIERRLHALCSWTYRTSSKLTINCCPGQSNGRCPRDVIISVPVGDSMCNAVFDDGELYSYRRGL